MRRVATAAGEVLRAPEALMGHRMGALVLGLDLGLAKCGWALWRLAGSAMVGVTPQLEDLGVWVTEKSDKKREVLSSNDDFRRARELARSLGALLSSAPRLRAVVVEAKSLPRNAASSCLIGMAWGIFAGEVERRGLPVVQASPQEVRHRLGLSKGMSKLDVRRAVFRTTPNMEGRLTGNKIPESLWEHPVDASAVVLACQDSEILRAVRGSF